MVKPSMIAQKSRKENDEEEKRGTVGKPSMIAQKSRKENE